MHFRLRRFKKFPDAEGVWSTRELFGRVHDCVKASGTAVRIAVENGTVADRYLHRTFEVAENMLRTRKLGSDDRTQLELLTPNNVRWHCESSSLAHTSFGQLKKACADTENAELLGVITWEPHATWLEAQDEAEEGLKKIPLHFSPDSHGRIPLMSFDLVMLRTSTIDGFLRAALNKLMQKLWQNATLLTELDGTSLESDPLCRIANYFGLLRRPCSRITEADLQRVRTALQGIRYSVHWSMESQSLIGSVPSA